MNWYIGQPIVAIVNHSQGAFKRGDEFVIKGLRETPCRCNYVEIDIGLSDNGTWNDCRYCGSVYDDNTSCHWFHENRFAPLDVNISELTEILEEPIFIHNFTGQAIKKIKV